jgi:hypothetical protein
MASPVSQAQPAARQVLRVDMGEKKAAVEAFCERQGTTVSQFVRAAVLKAMEGNPGADRPSKGKTAPAGKKAAAADAKEVRVEFVLTGAEDRALQERAEAAGFMSKRAYLAALVRANLGGGPQLGQGELQAMLSSSSQLTALLQLLRERPGKTPAEVSAVVREHLKTVKAVVDSNVRRWAT